MNEIDKKLNLKPSKKTFGNKKRILTGIKPTGSLHLGNYFSAIKPCIEMSLDEKNEVLLMCANWHGLTNKNEIFAPSSYTLPILSAYVALGFNLNNNSLFLQSDIPYIQENSWYLSCATASGLLERSHAYKDAIENSKVPTAGLLFYPVLMASDILSFDSQFVPVGKDQAQHLEYASDMAKYFNNVVSEEVFHEPKAIIQETPLLIGTDGIKKMGKSYNNTIPIFAAKKEVEKKVKEIVTDSKGLNDPKNSEECTIFQIFKSFASQNAIDHMKDKLENGAGYGYGHAKADFVNEHEKVFGLHREKYEYYCQNPDELKRLLKDGVERALSYAETVTQRARDALKITKFY